ncbi:hypothetical protein IID23_01605 [Patescibacteria group bacterium]|nr:hypothetical protein [Patescibacteria group bacterium]
METKIADKIGRKEVITVATEQADVRVQVANGLSLSTGLLNLIDEVVRIPLSLMMLTQEVPRGNREPMMCIQGLGRPWWDMEPMNNWLAWNGYSPIQPDLVLNVECPERTTRRLAQTVCRVVEQSETPLCLLGHSLGGLLAKAIEASVPEGYVSGVFLLGSPLKQIRIHRLMDIAARGLGFANNILLGTERGCFRGRCDCQFMSDVRSSLRDKVLYVSLFTKRDQIAEWNGCLLDEGPNRKNIEVRGTHLLLPSNPQVLLHIANLLPQIFSRETVATA